MFREHLGFDPQVDVAVVFCASVVVLHQTILFLQEAVHLFPEVEETRQILQNWAKLHLMQNKVLLVQLFFLAVSLLRRCFEELFIEVV